MKLCEKYWTAVLFTFLRYISVLMFLSGIGFIIAGKIVNPWFYLGLALWPLLLMLGVVNLKYINLIEKNYNIK